MDFLPTICRLAGAPVPAGLAPDGEDVTDILTGTTRPRVKPLYFQWLWDVLGNQSYWAPELAVRAGQWKFFMEPDGTDAALYDLGVDPTETKNLAAGRPEEVARLSAEVKAWLATLPVVKHKKRPGSIKIMVSPEP